MLNLLTTIAWRSARTPSFQKHMLTEISLEVTTALNLSVEISILSPKKVIKNKRSLADSNQDQTNGSKRNKEVCSTSHISRGGPTSRRTGELRISILWKDLIQGDQMIRHPIQPRGWSRKMASCRTIKNSLIWARGLSKQKYARVYWRKILIPWRESKASRGHHRTLVQ